MNPLSFVYLTCLLCCVFCGVFVYTRNPSDPINRFIPLVCSFIFFWIFPQFGFALCRSYEEAAIWTKIAAAWPFAYAGSVYLTLRLTEHEKLLKSFWIRGGIGIVAIVFTALELTVGVNFGSPRKYTMGWIIGKSPVGPVPLVSIAWCTFCMFFSFYLLVHYALTAQDIRKRKQVLSYLVAYSFAFVAVLIDIATINLEWKLPAVSPVGLLLTAVVVVFSMHKYQLFSLTPMTAAENIISTMDDMLFLVDTRGTILSANRAAYKTLGYSENELIGRSASTLFFTEIAWLRESLDNTAMRDQSIADLEISFIKKNQTTIAACLYGTAIRDSNANTQGLILIGRDITARKQAEKEKAELMALYQQSQKLESIGRLAGGIAHDINNILAAIMASTFVMKDDVPTDSKTIANIDNILSACYRGRDLTQNLLGFARKGKYVKKDVFINQVVMDTVAILEHTISKNVAIKTNLESQIGMFEGDLSQIQNVLLNICINAVDAIREQGEVLIESRAIDLSDEECFKLGDITPGNYVQLKIVDNGTGMDSDTLKNAVEPFFTTKPAGKGTGLGLSMAYGVVANHGGVIRMESEVGKGTVVTVYFPITKDGVTELNASDYKQEDNYTRRSPERARTSSAVVPVYSAHSRENSHVILLVDDEPLFQSSVKRLIQKLGYRVYVADSGDKALEIYQKNNGAISLILLDMVMPGLSGTDTFYKLKDINPQAKILIISGFDRDENVDKLLSNGAIGYLQKPFSLNALSRELDAVIKTDSREEHVNKMRLTDIG